MYRHQVCPTSESCCDTFNSSLSILFLIIHIFIQGHLVTKISPWTRGKGESIRQKQYQCTDGCVTWPSDLNLIGHLREDDTHPVISHGLIMQEALSQRNMDFQHEPVIIYRTAISMDLASAFERRSQVLLSQREKIAFWLGRSFGKRASVTKFIVSIYKLNASPRLRCQSL